MANYTTEVSEFLALLKRLLAGAIEHTHEGVVCNQCNNNAFIKGYRYMCLICKKHDLCEKCYQHQKQDPKLFHVTTHPMLKLRYPYLDEVDDIVKFNEKYSKLVHTAIVCDGCMNKSDNGKAIEGVRYSCSRCKDFDLCYSCFSNKHRVWPFFSMHSKRHPMYAIIRETPPTSIPNTDEEMPMSFVSLSHTNISCAVCGDTNFSDERYVCTICHDFDICGTCFEKQEVKTPHSTSHPVLRVIAPLTQEQNLALIKKFTDIETKFATTLHDDITCKQCSQNPLQGPRLHCDICREYNLCLTCYKKKVGSHDHVIEHQMVVMPEPYPPKVKREDIQIFSNSPLGEGGFGAVYKAKLRNLNFPVACKVITLNKEIQADPAKKKWLDSSFRKEIQAFSDIRCDNMIKMFGYCEEVVGESIKLIYLVEYMDNGDLHKFLRNKNYVSYRVKLKILTDIAYCMQRLHQKNYAHRDIRPNNILLNSKGQIKLCDMGIIKTIADDAKRARNTIVGCESYMPPEFMIGNYDPKKLDVFTFGLTMYEVITERHFSNVCGKVTFHSKAEILFDLIEKCVAPEAKRPSAEAILNQLQFCMVACIKLFTDQLKNLTEKQKDFAFQDIYPKLLEFYDQAAGNNSRENTLATNMKQKEELITSYFRINEDSITANLFGSKDDLIVMDKINTMLSTTVQVGESKTACIKAAEKNALIHVGITCATCRKANFSGERYQCTVCPNYNLCGRCFEFRKVSGNHILGHVMLYVLISELKSENSTVCAHTLDELEQACIDNDHQLPCYQCDQQITGLRFLCDDCLGCNFCYSCYKTQKFDEFHRSEHVVLVISTVHPKRIDFSEIEVGNRVLSKSEHVVIRRARHKLYSFPLACKIVQIPNDEDQTSKVYRTKCFFNELNVACNVRNDYFVKVLGYCLKETANRTLLIYVMEYINGTNMTQYMQKYENALPLQKRIMYLVPIALCLHSLHRKGFSHLNVKSKAVMIDVFGGIKLLDLSKIATSEKNTNEEYQSKLNTNKHLNGYLPNNYLAKIKDLRTIDIVLFGILINEIFTNQPHEVNDDKIIFVKQAPVFSDLVNRCVDLDETKRPSIKEILLSFIFIYMCFQELMNLHKIDYRNAAFDVKNNLFVLQYPAMQKELATFLETDWQVDVNDDYESRIQTFISSRKLELQDIMIFLNPPKPTNQQSSNSNMNTSASIDINNSIENYFAGNRNISNLEQAMRTTFTNKTSKVVAETQNKK